MIKNLLLAVLFTTFALPFSGALAQGDDKAAPSKAAESRGIEGNYLLTLVASGKDQPARELSVVLATPTFSTTGADAATSFAGSCNPQGEDTYLVAYSLGRTVAVPSGTNNINYRTTVTQASVQLHLGEPIQIIKDGDLSYSLKLDRYKAQAR